MVLVALDLQKDHPSGYLRLPRAHPPLPASTAPPDIIVDSANVVQSRAHLHADFIVDSANLHKITPNLQNPKWYLHASLHTIAPLLKNQR